MSYYEHLLELAKDKGIDPAKLTRDLMFVATVMGGLSIETVAESFIRAVEWEPKGERREQQKERCDKPSV